jgi:hypothetical protein
VYGRSTSSPDNKKFRTISVEKQGGMVFGFWKTVTAVTKPDGWIERYGKLEKMEKLLQMY